MINTSRLTAGLVSLFLIAGAAAPFASACECDKAAHDKAEGQHCTKKKCKLKGHGHKKAAEATSEGSDNKAAPQEAH